MVAVMESAAWMRAKVEAFFTSTGNAEDSDPLTAVVENCPDEAAWFIKLVMFYGAVFSVVVPVPCCVFLATFWTPCSLCNRPLHCWVLVHCVLQLLQAPVRFVFYARLRRTQQRGGNIRDCVRRVTHSDAWKTSKMVSVVTYGWFVLGMVWILNSKACGPCPGIYRLSLAVIFTAVARLLLGLGIFYRVFAPRLRAPATQPRGASQAVIDLVPTFTYISGAGETCSVCLSDYERHDTLRRLPCSHCFHRSCIDTWLRMNRLCPLCLRDIEKI